VSTLQSKVDFAVILHVEKANPNGDPLNGNQPRTDYNGYGEISDVCIKRKIRDRLMEKGESIFIQPKDRQLDGAMSLKDRAESEKWGLGKQAFVFTRSKNKAKKSASTEDAQELSELERRSLRLVRNGLMCVPLEIFSLGAGARVTTLQIPMMGTAQVYLSQSEDL
jgi:hypothetical protein